MEKIRIGPSESIDHQKWWLVDDLRALAHFVLQDSCILIYKRMSTMNYVFVIEK